jgi:sarcosine oxidase subunit beta
MIMKYDAVIIGAGIIGTCIAFELSKKGYKTLNVDKLPAAGHGSTANSCAVIRFHYSTPEGVAMAREGYHYWINWPAYLETEDERGLIRYINKGCLVIKTEINNYLKEAMKRLSELNIAFDELDVKGIRKRLPLVDTRRFFPVKLFDDPNFGIPTGDAIDGAIFIHESGYISDPQLSTHNVQRAVEARGGKFLFNAEVISINIDNKRAVGITLKDQTKITAPVIINVAGPHSAIINRMAGVEEKMNIKTRALRQEVCHLPAPSGFDYETYGTLVSDGDIGCYSRPETGNHILVGSEDPACDTMEYVDPDNYNQGFSEQWRTQVLRQAQRITGLSIPNQPQGIVDLYDVSDDWIPIYDKSDLPGFYMAVGTSGNQYKNAPVVGVLMAELIDKIQAGHDHDNDPVVLPLKYTGRTCNMRFFSRLREINRDSSFSVVG